MSPTWFIEFMQPRVLGGGCCGALIVEHDDLSHYLRGLTQRGFTVHACPSDRVDTFDELLDTVVLGPSVTTVTPNRRYL